MLPEQEKATFFSSIPIIRQNLDFFVIKFYSYFLQTKAGTLFHNTNLEKQYKMFHSSLTLIINHLENPDYVSDHLNKLIEVHLTYGVKKEHIDYFVTSFMKALKDIFSEQYDIFEGTWYEIINEIMRYFAKGIK